MEREKYLECLSIMAQVEEDEWYRDGNYLIQFYNPEKMSKEVLEAARLLNKNELDIQKWEESEENNNEPIFINL